MKLKLNKSGKWQNFAGFKKFFTWGCIPRPCLCCSLSSTMVVVIASTSDVAMWDSKIWQPPHVYVRGGLAGSWNGDKAPTPHAHASLRNFAACPTDFGNGPNWRTKYVQTICILLLVLGFWSIDYLWLFLLMRVRQKNEILSFYNFQIFLPRWPRKKVFEWRFLILDLIS